MGSWWPLWPRLGRSRQHRTTGGLSALE